MADSLWRSFLEENAMTSKGFLCPVCGFEGLRHPPRVPQFRGAPSLETCPSCGYEFGFDDLAQGVPYDEYREKWIAGGARWFSRNGPSEGWDPREQLKKLPE